MKIISPNLHGIIDYLVVVFLLISPVIFHMTPDHGLLTYALAFVHLILTLFTDFKGGLFKVISLPVHGFIELIVGITLVVLAYTYFKDDAVAKLFYTYFGIAVLAVYLLTDYKKPVRE
jgi:hypothetical protein